MELGRPAAMEPNYKYTGLRFDTRQCHYVEVNLSVRKFNQLVKIYKAKDNTFG